MDKRVGWAKARAAEPAIKALVIVAPCPTFRDCLGTLFRNSLTVGSLKKINNLFIKDIFHGYCLKRQSLSVSCWAHRLPEGAYRLMGTLRFVHPFMPSRFKNLPWLNCWIPDDCIGSKIESLLRAREVMELLVSTSAPEEAQ